MGSFSALLSVYVVGRVLECRLESGIYKKRLIRTSTRRLWRSGSQRKINFWRLKAWHPFSCGPNFYMVWYDIDTSDTKAFHKPHPQCTLKEKNDRKFHEFPDTDLKKLLNEGSVPSNSTRLETKLLKNEKNVSISTINIIEGANKWVKTSRKDWWYANFASRVKKLLSRFICE